MGLVKEFCGIVIILALVRCSQTLSSGAPVVACVTLTPSHTGALPQTTPSPYTLRSPAGIPINGISIHAGDTYRFALEADGNVQFRGFIVQARTVQGAVIGTFATGDGVQLMTCLPSTSTVIHTNNADKQRVEFELTAPAPVVANIVLRFHFSVVQSHQIFWTNMETGLVIILPDSGATTGETTTSGDEGETTIQGDETTIEGDDSTIESDETTTEVVPPAIRNPYPGCGTTKVCFGTPAGCLVTNDCNIFSAVIFEDDKFTFELLSGDVVEYVAVAVSRDDRMGSSSAMECVGRGGIVTAFTSFTVGTSAAPRDVDQSIIRLKYYQNINGRIYCQIERNTTTVVGGFVFDLLNQPQHLLLASGPSVSEDMVNQHDDEAVSPLVNLTIPAIIEEERRVLVLVHGGLMIVAWILLSSVGIFIARCFKETWKAKTICGHAVWFFWHFMCMLLTWILTISSFVIIFVEVGEWRTSVHAVTGTVVTVLVFFQPVGAIFRPNPTHPNRPIFNFLHFMFGNIIHALAIITIFYAVPMSGSDLPSWTSFILVAFVVFYLLMHAIMTTVRICGTIKSKNQKLGPSKDASNPLLTKTVLGFFLLTVFLFAVALLLIMALPTF